MEYAVQTTIAAPPEALWALLVDAPAYPRWNPTVTKVEGQIAAGRKIKVFAAGMDRAFPVKVSELSSPRRMTWTGGMPFGLFKGVRTFELEPQGDGRTRFSMREVFTGPLVGLISKSMPDLQPVFDDFAAALKRKAEGS